MFSTNDALKQHKQEGKGGKRESSEGLAGAVEERGELLFPTELTLYSALQLLSEEEKTILAEEEAAFKDNKDCLVM